MATAKPQSRPPVDTENTDPGVTTEAATQPEPVPEAQAPDFSASPNWGHGGRFVITSAGQRVPASTTDQE